MRPSVVQFSIRRLMIVVATVAVSLFVYIKFRQISFWRGCSLCMGGSYEGPIRDQDVLRDLCKIEAEFMNSQSVACLERSLTNAPWDALDEATENLKIHPFPSDDAPCSSWSDQAAVWRRAADRCARAAGWYGMQ